MAHYPADTFQEATEIAIEASNQLHGVINGDANAEVTVEDGSKIPSVRKAMVDSLYFKPPIAWAQGEYEDTYNQLREFVDGDVRTWWFAKGATVSTPVLMTTNPATDPNWTLWSAVTLNAATYETQKRLAAEAGLNMVGSFLLGGTVTNVGDVVFCETDGKYYGWGGTLPKTVPAGSTPATSGGIGVNAWVDRTQETFKSELADINSSVEIAGMTAADIVKSITGTFNVYTSDYGVVGDTVDDMTAALSSATAYASEHGFNLVVDVEGTILVSQWRIPSNIHIRGIGEGRTIIKQISTADINAHTVTNDQNQVLWSDSVQTGFYESNNGNEYIYLSDMTIDGNGFRAAQYSGYGTALALSNVKHSVIENVTVINGHQHCIDVCGADYSERGELGIYSAAKKGSFNVHLINCKAIDPVSDDAITTHTSGNIWIYNPYSLNNGTNVGYNQQGLEIDDGSWDVHVIGGYAKGFAKGLQIKGHSSYTMAANICTVDGFISDGNKWGFNVEHGLTAGTTTESAIGVVLKNCKNIRCKDVIDTNSSLVVGLKALMVDSYIGVSIENFTSYGDIANLVASDYISIEKNSKCVRINGAIFYNIPAASAACIVTGDAEGGTTGSNVRNIRIEHIVAQRCSCPVILGMSTGAHHIDDIYAVSTSGVTVPYAVMLNYSALDNLTSKGNYVGTIFTSGYTNEIVSYEGYSGGTHARVPASDSYDFSLDYKARFAYAGDSGTDRYFDFGILSSGSHIPATNYGVGHRFRLKHTSGAYSDMGAIVARLTTGATSPATILQFYVNNGTTNAARMQLNNDGTLRATVDNSSSLGTASFRWSVIYAGTGTINTSDETTKTFCDGELSDAVLDVWEGLEWRAFKFNDAIETKGLDKARIHFGLGAQTVKKAFEGAGLDPFKYALLCYDEWEETEDVIDEDGNVIVEGRRAGSRYGIRYEEALALEAAVMRRSISRLNQIMLDIKNIN